MNSNAGALISCGVNLVLSSQLSAAHAEVVALSLAQSRLGTWDLSQGDMSCELVVNWRPCVQCYGAVLWSGVRRLVLAGAGDELEQLTKFDEGPLREDWAEQLLIRGIDVKVGVLRDEALRTFRDYRQLVSQGKASMYDPRRSAR